MNLNGLIAAPHAPFFDNYSLNNGGVMQQAEHLNANGVLGAFVAGTTGECFSMTTVERGQLFMAWGEAAREHDIRFIAHVGHNSLMDAAALVAAAEKAGADAISAMAPFFFKPDDASQLLDWFSALLEPAGGLPFYFYDIPSMTGVTIDTHEFVQRAQDRLPGFAGVKYSNPNVDQLKRILSMENAPDIFWGFDELYLEGMQIGCTGAVGSSYNFAAPIYHRVTEALRAGDLEEASHWQERAAKSIEMIAAFGYLPAAKNVMRWVGVDCGPARPPLANLSGQKMDSLRAELDSVGFFEWIDECKTA